METRKSDVSAPQECHLAELMFSVLQAVVGEDERTADGSWQEVATLRSSGTKMVAGGESLLHSSLWNHLLNHLFNK